MGLKNRALEDVKSSIPVEGAEQFLRRPSNPAFGDMSLSLAFKLAKERKKSPQAIAEELLQEIQIPEESFISDIQAIGGYINFFYDYRKLADILLPSMDESYGSSDIGKGTRVMVEHTSVNPNKALHIGHARNCCLGDSLARILRFSGYDMQVANYIDDTGPQVADIVVGIKFLGFPQTKDGMKLDQYYGDEIYVKVNKLYEERQDLEANRRDVLRFIDEGDNEVAYFAKELVEKILKSQLETLWRLDIYYDLLNHESDILAFEFWDKAFEKLKEGGYVAYEEYGPNAGCWVLKLSHFPEFKDLVNPDKVLIRSDGTTVYAAKDTAYAMWKHGILGKDFDYDVFVKQPNGEPLWTTTKHGKREDHPEFGNVDISVNVIDARQSHEQDVVRTALDLLSNESKDYRHYAYEIVSLSANTARQLGIDTKGKDFVHMSGRKGLYINTDTVLDALTEKAYQETKRRNPLATENWLRSTADKIAVGALRHEMESVDYRKLMIFDLDKSLRLEGDTGPYLQYTFARACNILNRVGDWQYEPVDALHEKERELIRSIIDFPEAVEDAALSLQPFIVCKYANRLSAAFNSFYQKCKVLRAKSKTQRNFRASLVDATRHALGNSLYLIGVDALEKI